MNEQNLIRIESEYISAVISTEGAQIKSLLDLDSGVEYIIQDQKLIHPLSSIFSFPFVGKLKDDKYILGSKFHQMHKNGFAKDLNFTIREIQKDQVSLMLTHNEQTLICYPYRFNLTITFKVYGPKLTVSIEVKNMDKREMLFSIGYSSIFNIPLRDEKFEDYYLEFSNHEVRGGYNLDNDLVNFNHTDNKKILDDRKLLFKKDIFKHGEIIFKDISSSSVVLKNKVNEKSIDINFSSIPYLTINSFPGSNFIELRPSFGVPDSLDATGDIYTKEGIVDLEAEKTFKFDITYHIR